MTEKELKRRIKESFVFPESEREKTFIKAYEQRSMQLSEIVFDELKFMGWKSLLSGAVFCLMLLSAANEGNTSFMWTLASSLPLFALLLTFTAGRSERFGMAELEASSRFSLRFIRAVRMLIIGSASLILIFVSTLIVRKNVDGQLLTILCFLAAPYLINVFSCLIITRKRHMNDDLVICAVCTVISCLIPGLVKALNLFVLLSNGVALALLSVVLILTIRESVLYVQNGKHIEWNC